MGVWIRVDVTMAVVLGQSSCRPLIRLLQPPSRVEFSYCSVHQGLGLARAPWQSGPDGSRGCYGSIRRGSRRSNARESGPSWRGVRAGLAGDRVERHRRRTGRQMARRRRSVLEPEACCAFGGQLVGKFLAVDVVDLLVRHEVPKEDASSRANHPVGNALLLQEA